MRILYFKKTTLLLSCILTLLLFNVPFLKSQEDPNIRKIRPYKEKLNLHLLNSMKKLKNDLISKIEFDIDITASAFADAQNIQRSLKWADIFGTGLDIIKGTIDSISKLLKFTNPSKALSEEFVNYKLPIEVFSFFLTIESLARSGDNLNLAIDGPAYTSNIRKMLDEAYKESSTRLFFNYEAYRIAIKNHVLGIHGFTPLIIPRRSSDLLRQNIEFTFGAYKIEKAIIEDYRELEIYIEKNPIPYDLEIEITNLVEKIRKDILRSKLNGIKINYQTYLKSENGCVPTELEIYLGSIAELERARMDALESFDKKLERREIITLSKAVGGILNTGTIYLTMNCYTTGFNNKLVQINKLFILPKGIDLADNIMKSVAYETDSRNQINMKPQEMLISLSKELSDLWMLSDDLINYIKYNIRTLNR